MLLSSWLKSLAFPSRRQRPRRFRRQHLRRKLATRIPQAAELLEDRTLLSTTTLLAGEIDNFADPPDPASPSAALANSDDFPSRDFDEIPSGQFKDFKIAHTFDTLFDSVREGLPVGALDGIDTDFTIKGATLRFRVQAGDVQNVFNDAVILGFYGSGLEATVWSASFPELDSSWQNNSVAEFLLDLSALPNSDGSTTNVVPLLNERDFLDVKVKDDTGVDFYELTIDHNLSVWDGGGDGSSWNDPANWAFDTLPETGDDVVIPDVATTDRVVVQGLVRAGQMFSDEDLDLATSSAKLHIEDGLTLNGTMTLRGERDANARASRLVFEETTSGTQTLDGTGTVVFDFELVTTSGATVSTEDAELLIQGDTELTVGPDITIRGDRGLIGSTFSDTDALLNQGTIAADEPIAGLGLLDFRGLTIQTASFTNAGTVEAGNGGLVNMDSTNWSSTGIIRADGTGSSATVILKNTFTLPAGHSFELIGGGEIQQRGTLENAGNTVSIDTSDGTYLLTSNTEVRGGTLAGPAGSELDVGFATFQGVTADIDLDLTPSGTLIVDDGLTLNGTMTLRGERDSNAFASRLVFEETTSGTQTLDGTGTVVFDFEVVDTTGATVSTEDAELLIQGDTVLTIGPDITVRGDRGLIGSSFSDTDALVNQGTIAARQSAGIPLSGSSLTIQTASFTNEGTIEASNGGELDINSTNWSSTGTIRANGTGSSATVILKNTFTLPAGHSFELIGGGEIQQRGTLENAGNTVSIDTSDGTYLLTSNTEVRGGTLAGPAGSELDVGFATFQGVTADIDLDSGTLLVDDGLTLNGTMTLRGERDSNARASLLRFEETASGTQTLDGTGEVVFDFELVTTSGATVSTEDAELLIQGDTVLTIGPDITVRGDRGLIGSSFSDTDALVNQGTIAARQSAGIPLSGSGLTIQSASFTNEGSVEVRDAGLVNIVSTPTNFSAGTFTGGTWSVFSDSRVLLPSGTDVSTNNATILLDGATAALEAGSGTDALAGLAANAAAGSFTIRNGHDFTTVADLTNDGDVVIASATELTVNGDYTQTAGSTVVDGILTTTGAVDIQGGTLSGTGTVNGDTINAGTVGPGTSPGVLDIDGDYTQTASGVLNVEIGGTATGAFDQLNVTGTATLDGTLNVSLIDGFDPAVGDEFKILTYTARVGDFDTDNGLLLDDGKFFSKQFNESTLPFDLTLVTNPPEVSPLVVTNTNDSGIGSLRGAIEFANSNPGPDTIEFNIPETDPGFVDVDSGVTGGDADPDVFVIQPESALPALIDDGTTIDGRIQTTFGGDTNPFGPEIVLNGASAGTDGLQILADDNAVFDLNIQGFSGNGIRISGADNNQISGSYIGTDATGTTPLGNAGDAVFIGGGATNNLIGTDGDGTADEAERNVISGNDARGVLLSGSGVANNIVAGNYVGVDATGAAPLGNGFHGVQLVFGAHNNLVGTDGDGTADAAERNVIADNAGNGVRLGRDTTQNVVAGNFIGTDVTGSVALGNVAEGVLIRGAAQSNLIGTDGDGTADEAERNVISGNDRHGILISNAGTEKNVVAGNFIGTDVTGTANLGNARQGVLINGGASDNLIGTDGDGVADVAERNVISGNARHGVEIVGAGTDENIVAGNLVGTNADGTAALGNGTFGNHSGVFIRAGAQRNLIGTNGDGIADAAERNVVSGNLRGVAIDDSGSTENVVAGNFVGTDINGTASLPNQGPGVTIFLAENNTIGTDGDGLADAAERNIISGNAAEGVRLNGAIDNVIAGNYIGTDVNGTAGLGNGDGGIEAFGGASNNLIGTDGDGSGDIAERNVISGNEGNGVSIEAAPTRVTSLSIVDQLVSGALPSTTATATIDQADLRDQTNGPAGNWGFDNPVPGGGGDDYAVVTTGTLQVDTAGTFSFALGGDDGGRLRIDGADVIVDDTLHGFLNRFGDVTLDAGEHTFEWVGFERGGGAGFELSVAVGAGKTGPVTTANGWHAVGDLGSVPEIGLDGSLAVTAYYSEPVGRDNIVAGNFIGTDAAGTTALGNQGDGVRITGGASDNLIGTDGDGTADAAEQNVISGNAQRGVFIANSGTDNNVVAGNYIGTDVTGTVDLGNDLRGVLIAAGAQANLIGTDGDGIADVAERNLISGNVNNGVRIQDPGTDNNVVAGNHIGTDVTGNVALGSQIDGVTILFGAQFNRVGTDGDGIGDAAERNVISGGNTGAGVSLTAEAEGNVVAGNYIGTDVTGTNALGNGQMGVFVGGAARFNLIGTDGDGVADAAERNIVSGNVGRGIRITGSGTDENVVAGNYIGTDVTGTATLGNGNDGVRILGGASLNRIGTDGDGVADIAERNVVSGNDGNGIEVAFDGSDNNVIAGNYVGVDATGDSPLGNGNFGVFVNRGPQHTLIGTDGDGVADEAERNVISANASRGVLIFGDGTDHNVLAGNYIGTDASGTDALGNGNWGVIIRAGAQFNLIGTDGDGTGDVAERNIVSGNLGGAGVAIFNTGTDQNTVAGNFIGTDVTGTEALGNARQGVWIANFGTAGPANNNVVGTDGDGIGDEVEGNLISGNGRAGIRMGDVANNVIAGNLIGTDVTGTDAVPNAVGTSGFVAGIWMEFGTGNRIGTDGNGVSDEAERNIISGNANDGILLFKSQETVVAGNYIGTDITGTAPLGNGRNGIAMSGGAVGNLVGTDGDDTADVAERNLISGNALRGVRLQNSATVDNVVAGNFIGTDVTGTAALGNGLDGVFIRGGAQSNLIGTDGDGTADAAEGNTIAFNVGAGVAVLGDTSTGNTIRRNSIHSNGGLGIDLGEDGVTANDNNDPDTGPNELQNFPVLDFVLPGDSTRILGGLDSAAETTFTVEFFAGGEADSSGFGEGERFLGATTVTTNPAGLASFDVTLDAATTAGEAITATATDPDGNTSEFSRAVSAGAPPVLVVTNTNDLGPGSLRQMMHVANVHSDFDSISFNIPETDPGFVDVDSGMTGGDADPDVFVIQPASALPALTDDGTSIDGRTQATFGGDTNPFGPEVVLNGTDAGTAASGFRVRSDDNEIHGLVIQEFDFDGVRIRGSDGNLVAGSYIGTDATGTQARGNGEVGVRMIQGAQFNVVGTNGDGVNDASEGNLISGNGTGNPDESDGVRLAQTGTSRNTVAGNRIGTDRTGLQPLGNAGNGVFIKNGARSNLIGSDFDGVSDALETNVIAFNGNNGVRVRNDESLGNRIRRNAIHSNDALGIDLGNNDQIGVTPNDSNDDDNGPNRLRNFPVLRFARAGDQTQIVGTYSSTPVVREYVLDFYASPQVDPSGHGEGARWIGSAIVETNDEGNSGFNVTFGTPTGPEAFITSTATDTAGNTSEFSQALSLDRTPPTSRVDPLPRRAASKTFTVSVTGNDRATAGELSSGVSAFDVFASVDGGPFELWRSLPADSPSAGFTAESNTTYAFYSVAVDNADNVEEQTTSVEASIFVPDLDVPTTQVTSVDADTPTFTVDFEGTDSGGSGLSFFDVFVEIDGGAAQNIGSVTADDSDGDGTYIGSVSFQALADDTEHTYRFFTVGTDGNENVEAAPETPADVLLTRTFAAPDQIEVTNFDVQKGANQRSFIRFLDVTFNKDGEELQAVVDTLIDDDPANDRIRLQRFGLDGGGAGDPVALSASMITISGQSLQIDFGSAGLGGSPNTNAADGYYSLDLDLDGDGSFTDEADDQLNFYRLLGDANGDRKVDETDLELINGAVGQTGSNLDEDINGDGVVDVDDLFASYGNLGAILDGSLELDD